MALRQYQASGPEYLELITALLQQARRANPLGGVWEAADLQWWWRRDQHRDPARQTFWLDGDRPIAAAVMTDWGGRFGCDVMSADHDLSKILETIWPRTLEQIDALPHEPVEIAIRDDDLDQIEAATAAGFEDLNEVGIATWMPAADHPAVTVLPDGFELTPWADHRFLRHPLITRSGEQVSERLHECSLYREDLDLAVYAPDGELAAYGLFWADPVTGVGLVEPMRTEVQYQGMGLARHILTSGLDRMAQRGCTAFKVSYIVGNEASRRLYLGAGFRPDAPSRMYRRPPAGC